MNSYLEKNIMKCTKLLLNCDVLIEEKKNRI